MLSDAAHIGEARTCRTNNTMFMVSLPPGARRAVSPHAMRDLS